MNSRVSLSKFCLPERISSGKRFQSEKILIFAEFFPCLLFCFEWVSVFKAAFMIGLCLCPNLISTSSRKLWLSWIAKGATHMSEWNRSLRSSRLKDCCSTCSPFFFFFMGFLHCASLWWLSGGSHSDDLFSLVSRLPFFIFNNKCVFLHCSASLRPLISHRLTPHGRLRHSVFLLHRSATLCSLFSYKIILIEL